MFINVLELDGARQNPILKRKMKMELHLVLLFLLFELGQSIKCIADVAAIENGTLKFSQEKTSCTIPEEEEDRAPGCYIMVRRDKLDLG